jgi:formylglycine-generating enzyme required for sulfatase activity
MDPITLVTIAITLISTKAVEKVGEKMGEQVASEARKLLEVLRRKAPDTANKLLLISDLNSIDRSIKEEVEHLSEADSEVKDAIGAMERVMQQQFTNAEQSKLSFPNETPLLTLSLKRRPAKARYFTQEISNAVGIDMVQIPGGSFMMGSPEAEEGHESNESPQHLVTLPSFFMGKYPVTQAQWRSVVSSTTQVKRSIDPEPSNFKGDDLPVEQVSWLDAEEFCLRLSKLSDREYRLPTEAEWEYACRAGTTTPFHFGETIDSDIANYRAQAWELVGMTYPGKYGLGELGEFRNKTTPVGSFKLANRFGLYDMHGNVWEWCLDHWHGSYQGAPKDGSAWLGLGAERMLRGGSWRRDPANCRSASRHVFDAVNRRSLIGFRLVSPA